MKGTVEIYRNFGTSDQELLHKEDNLLVDGAAEVLCDLFTTPSGAVSSVSNLMDSSNFTIQAFSLGKASNSYKTHAHFYPFDFSSHAAPTLPYYGYVDLIKNDNTLRVVSTSGQNIANSVSSFDPINDVGTTPNPTDKALEPYTNTAIDVIPTQIHYMNKEYMQGRSPAFGHNLNRLISNSNPNLISYTNNPHNPVWVSSNIDPATGDVLLPPTGGVSAVTISGTNTGPFYGTSAFLVEGSGAAVVLRHDVSANRPWAERRYFHENLNNTFSVYVRLPDNLDLAPSNVVLTMKGDNMTAVLSHFSKATFNLSGGNDNIPAHFVYQGAGNGSGAAETLGIGATSSHVGWQRLHVRANGLMGATNGNKIRPMVQFNPSAVSLVEPGNYGEAHLYQYGWQLEESYGPTPFQEVSGVRPSFDEGGLAGDLFLGCWPDISGTKFAITSSIVELDPALPYKSTFMASGIYPMTPATDPFFNLSSVRCMDQNGFVQVQGPLAATAYDTTKGLVVSAAITFSATGEVAYQCTISSGDLGLANLYGGIFKCGLWTLDLNNTMQGNIGHYHNGKFGIIQKTDYPAQPPFNFKAGNSNLVYKLFAEKSFTFNLCRIQDNGTAAGFLNYDPLTLIWRLYFI